MRIDILIGAGVFCLVVIFFVVRREHRRMEKEYDQLLQSLDQAIAGKIQDADYDESMDAAVKERLNRVVEISRQQKDQAEEERDTVKALISDISHQVRTPLSNIMLYTGLLQEESLEPAAVQLADKIQKNSEKLDFFMKELVKSSYAEQEMIILHPEPVNLRDMVEKACQNIELAALKKKIVIHIQAEDVECCADFKWTTEAISNIVENAVKYSPEDSTITVETLQYDSFLCVRVSDRGIGIPEEEQGKVFQRFYRGKAVKNKDGFGIGLYLAREVLSKQGGYIKLKSKPGEGTAVELYLSK